MLVLTQPRTLSAFFCCQGTQLAHVPCLPRSPGSFQQNCCQPVSAQTVLLQKVIPPQMQTLHLSVLDFIMFLLAHFSAYLSPSEWWPCPRVYQLSPIHFVPPTNLMSMHSTTSSRSLIKTLKQSIPCGSPLVTGFKRTTTSSLSSLELNHPTRWICTHSDSVTYSYLEVTSKAPVTWKPKQHGSMQKGRHFKAL